MTIRYKNMPIKSTNVRSIAVIKKQLKRILFSVLWNISGVLSRLVVKRMFFLPISFALTNEQKIALSTAKQFSFRSGDTILKGYQWGHGPAVVFIHGWAGKGLQFHRYLPSLLASGFSVFTFDHAGHGASEGKTASYFQFSEAVFDFFEDYPGLDLQGIVAHSLGASAAINYLWGTKRKTNTILIAPALNLIEMLDKTFARYGVPKRVYSAVIRELELKTGHTFALENPIDLLGKLTQDIMIVHDTEDKVIHYEESWDASLVQNNISLFPTKGLGHIRILEDEILIAHIVKKITSAPMIHF